MIKLTVKVRIFCRLAPLVVACFYATDARAQGTIELAKTSTVRIEGAVQGSGVIINKNLGEYTVLTAWHVIKSNQSGEEISIVTHDGRSYLSSIRRSKRVGSLDMAVIDFSSNIDYRVAATLKSSKRTKSQDPIFIAGYPNKSPGQLAVSRGYLVANAEVGIDQGYQLLYDSATSPGMSGGPVFNLDFDVVGIHGRGELDIKTYLSSGKQSKTSISQGIPIYYFDQFVNGREVKSRSQSASTWDDYMGLLNQLYLTDDDTGHREIKPGQAQTAIRIIDQVIRLRPELSFAHALKGVLMSDIDPSLGQFNVYTKASIKLLNAYQSISEKARKLFYEERLDESLELFKYAVRFVHNVGAENHMYMASIYGTKKNFDAAIAEAQKGLAIASNLYKRGLSVTTLQPADASISQKELDATTITVLYRTLAAAYMWKDDYDNAASTYDEAIDVLLSLEKSDYVKSALGDAYAGRASATLFLTNRSDWACDYYSDAKGFGASDLNLEKLCEGPSSRSNFDPSKMKEMMNKLAADICLDRAPYEPVNFHKEAEALVQAVKGAPKFYTAFKSDSSLLAWAYTIAYKAFQICPETLPAGAVVRPDESWNWEGLWDHVNPKKS